MNGRYFSMFTGVGGFELGLSGHRSPRPEGGRSGQSLHSELKESSSQKHNSSTCVGFSEIDKYANELLAAKWPNIPNYGDCTKINPSELPDFDMLCGGFPCQSFSIAGKRRGFEDTRGTMFFEIARILEVKRPKLILLENVKGLLNHNKGQTFSVILQTLEELGYRTQWMVLNSKFFGVPQNRERVFIVGSLRGTSRPEILPFRADEQEVTCEYPSQISGCVTSRYFKQGNADTYVREIGVAVQGSQAMRVYTPELAPTLKGLGGGCGAKTGLYAIPFALRSYPRNESRVQNPNQERHQNIEFRKDECTNTLSSVEKDNMILSHSPRTNDSKLGGSGPLISDKHSFTIDRTPHNVIMGMKIRRLTPIECERLQGFPDNWTEGFSDTQRYKMMGNAVTVNVIRAIAQRLI